MRDLFLGFLAALLPAPERDAFVHRHGVDPAGWSGFLGLVEFFAGGLAVISNGLDFFHQVAERNAVLFLDTVEANQLSQREMTAYMLSGVANWVEWLAGPWTWLLISISAVGMLRLVTYGLHHEASGEPLVWAGLRLARFFERRLGASRERIRFGPERPDRVEAGPGGGLTILSCRPKPDWNPRVTIEIDGRFYRLVRTEERQDGAWWMHAHVLAEQPENEVIRALVRYNFP